MATRADYHEEVRIIERGWVSGVIQGFKNSRYWQTARHAQREPLIAAHWGITKTDRLDSNRRAFSVVWHNTDSSDGTSISSIHFITSIRCYVPVSSSSHNPRDRRSNCRVIIYLQSSRHCLSCLTSLVATPASTRPACATDSEEDAVNGGMHTFNQTHMRKAFQLMNDLRRCDADTFT